MLRIIIAGCMAIALMPISALCAPAGGTDTANAFQTALQHARTEQVADAWPVLVLSRAEAFQRGWSIAAFAPVRGKFGVWAVSFTRDDAGQPPVTRLLSSTTCPAIKVALSSLSEADMPHIFLPGYPSDGEETGPLILDGPSLELWSSTGRYFGGPEDEEQVQVTVRGTEHSRFGRAASAALDSFAKCS